ncbi:hypothetical protein GIB67_006706 [Kingdonia uniflora]|uniref:Ribosomal protein L34e superfamily protein n=1 Tax=Kingdonia uniflora TaxID=39325 RepID=A0A7J7LYN9_9MAGN|nr:hypothetical protein GIB67_006706 [Kingdonia uniflora]
MKLPMVDCRSLIEFCRAFEHHRLNRRTNSSLDQSQSQSRSRKHQTHNGVIPHPFCNHAPFAAIDALMLVLVVGALSFLTVPYFNLIFREAAQLFPVACVLMGDVIYNAPIAYAVGLVLAFVIAIGVWEVINHKSRKCGNPYCKGLRKAVEFDIQLESEECVKYLPTIAKDGYGVRPLELGRDHKELEAELKRMAPLNGRTVLIFRAPCGCPAGRMEVWGNKKLRRIKK